MSVAERRKTFGFRAIGQPERYFILFQFILLMFTMIYLLYLIFGTINGVFLEISKANETIVLASVFDRISFLLLIRVSILFGVVFIVNLFLGLFYLQRLTGPLGRIQAVLTQIGSGQVPATDVMLRKGDFPIDLAQALARALKQIRSWRSRPS
ncbi:MAG: hypothetical protein A3C35_01400 [Omnitrophica bacterium RIFCSPHIGHO2_02_FULL_46_11]|nr:MAG: hypothetical protein A3C35_01400 [Omnitrophica bacterium RIFCSPHIGHO2_02_FULL_46_11]OGW86180.1 MAG: hypothetical protein A3A81_05365 [Omnitrophica bacterium RIFCSPLOWO2_01_FULL_45_10b]